MFEIVFTMILTFLTLHPIEVSLYPSISTAPADIRLTLTIPRNPLNEAYCLEWDGGDAGTSCVEMLGDKEPVTKQIWLKSLSSGEYTLEATLYQHGGKTFTDIKQFTVN